MNSFKIKNKFIVGLGSWLNELPLSGKESRERTRFVSLLVDRLTEVEKFRTDLLEKHVKKDEKGEKKKVMIEEQEIWDMTPENQVSYGKELTDLMDEEFVIDVLEGNKEKVKVVKNIVLNTSYVFGPKEGDSIEEKNAKIRQMNDYNIWCESFDAVTIE